MPSTTVKGRGQGSFMIEQLLASAFFTVMDADQIKVADNAGSRVLVPSTSTKTILTLPGAKAEAGDPQGSPTVNMLAIRCKYLITATGLTSPVIQVFGRPQLTDGNTPWVPLIEAAKTDEATLTVDIVNDIRDATLKASTFAIFPILGMSQILVNVKTPLSGTGLTGGTSLCDGWVYTSRAH